MNRNPYGDHLAEQVYSASPVELTALLNRALLESVKAAARCIAAGDIGGRSRQITRAIAILSELTSALDPSADRAYADRVSAIYEYLCDRIRTANATQTESTLREAEEVLRPLVEAWEQLACASWEPDHNSLVELSGNAGGWETARLGS